MSNNTKTKHVSVTAYNNHLIIEYHAEKSIPDEVVCPFDSSSMGYVILGTEHVGVSKEAYAFLKLLRPGRDSLGELDIFQSGDQYVFGTLGGNCVLCNMNSVETSRQWKVPPIERFQLIENDVPEGAKAAVDGA